LFNVDGRLITGAECQMAQFFERSKKTDRYARMVKSFDSRIWCQQIRRRLFRDNHCFCIDLLVTR
jgi:hypothetical protein